MYLNVTPLEKITLILIRIRPLIPTKNGHSDEIQICSTNEFTKPQLTYHLH
jgi:hypothetical protein